MKREDKVVKRNKKFIYLHILRFLVVINTVLVLLYRQV
jgi:hypothetical protein